MCYMLSKQGYLGDQAGHWHPHLMFWAERTEPKSWYLPITIARTRLALAGKSETQMLDAINSALDKKELPALEAGAMCYMLSKQGYLGDQAGHWHPHLMFWAERTEPKSWGAGMSGS